MGSGGVAAWRLDRNGDADAACRMDLGCSGTKKLPARRSRCDAVYSGMGTGAHEYDKVYLEPPASRKWSVTISAGWPPHRVASRKTGPSCRKKDLAALQTSPYRPTHAN